MADGQILYVYSLGKSSCKTRYIRKPQKIIGLGIVTVMGSGLALRVAKSQPDAVNCFDLGSGLKQV